MMRPILIFERERERERENNRKLIGVYGGRHCFFKRRMENTSYGHESRAMGGGRS